MYGVQKRARIYDGRNFGVFDRNRLLRIHSLGRYVARHGVGTHTTETNWASPDFERRVLAHVVTVDAILAAGAVAAGQE